MQNLTIAISGSTGLVGTRLSQRLRELGHTVRPLVRNDDDDGIPWDPIGGHVGEGLAQCDAVVHLAGAPIAEHRWTDEVKDTIRASRVLGTRTLVRALDDLPPRPLISTSAVGYYGDRDDEELDEQSLPGTGFLAEVSAAWEEEARQAPGRVAIVRTGLVLAAHGGLLEPLLPLYKVGAGGPIGGGDQWMSWIHLDDLVGLYVHLLTHEVEGVFNGVAPNPVQNRFFAKVLGRVLERPAVLPTPAFGVRLALGREKADELVLASQRVHPTASLAAGHRFEFPRLEEALRDLL